MSESIFFTSDTHFDHKNIVWLGKGRPWDDALDMTEGLIENWNERVRRGDRVYHLGDFAFANKARTAEILKRLNGQIHFVRGNHDSGMDRFAGSFASYQSYKEIKVGEQRICLLHFPMLTWHKIHHGSWHLHGHCHGLLQFNDGAPRMDVGVDPNNYYPVAYEEVAERMTGREFTPYDHHIEGID